MSDNTPELKRGIKIPRGNEGNFGKKEIERVRICIEDASRKLSEIKFAKIQTPQGMYKTKELESAIYIGNIYLKKLIDKWTH